MATKPDLTNIDHDLQRQRSEVWIDKERWKNRREMAWIALASMLAFTAMLMFLVPVAKLTALGSVISWFYGTMMSIIGFYIGFTTWAYTTTSKTPPPVPQPSQE